MGMMLWRRRAQSAEKAADKQTVSTKPVDREKVEVEKTAKKPTKKKM